MGVGSTGGCRSTGATLRRIVLARVARVRRAARLPLWHARLSAPKRASRLKLEEETIYRSEIKKSSTTKAKSRAMSGEAIPPSGCRFAGPLHAPMSPQAGHASHGLHAAGSRATGPHADSDNANASRFMEANALYAPLPISFMAASSPGIAMMSRASWPSIAKRILTSSQSAKALVIPSR